MGMKKIQQNCTRARSAVEDHYHWLWFQCPAITQCLGPTVVVPVSRHNSVPGPHRTTTTGCGASDHYHKLWCQCGGDAGAVPREARLRAAIARLQEGVAAIGVAYVACVVCVFLATLLLLLCRAGYGAQGFMSLVTCACVDQSSPALSSRRRRRPAASSVLQRDETLVGVAGDPEPTRRTVATLRVPGQPNAARPCKVAAPVRALLGGSEGLGNPRGDERGVG
ncbi:uncharacterized protein LOC125178234 [Hyalella azteca]|uniref:Uncharacterized protein LOC125178234 n=1 Tax=Hyalella azteca TaxID=294128 RepID=A0A979FKE4_HYAAZ|nr:uncharacterized protein LOC125178234 [Hyalella azteca]